MAGLALAAAFVCCVGFRQLRDRSSPRAVYERGATIAGMDAPVDGIDVRRRADGADGARYGADLYDGQAAR